MIPILILTMEDESSREFMLRLYESCVSQMYREAGKYFSAKEDIEDVVSEAVVKLVNRIDTLQELERAKRLPYAVTTVRHVALNFLRRRNHFRMECFDDLYG